MSELFTFLVETHATRKNAWAIAVYSNGERKHVLSRWYNSKDAAERYAYGMQARYEQNQARRIYVGD